MPEVEARGGSGSGRLVITWQHIEAGSARGAVTIALASLDDVLPEAGLAKYVAIRVGFQDPSGGHRVARDALGFFKYDGLGPI